MIRHRGAYSFAVAGDEIDDAGRDSSLFTSFHEVVSRERRVFSRFDDNGVSANQCRNQFPRRNRHWKVPRRDQSAKTDRLADAHRKLVAHLSRSGEAVQATAFARSVVSAVDSFLNVAAGFFQNLAHLARHVGCELFLVLDQYLAETEQDFSAFGCGRVTPAIE